MWPDSSLRRHPCVVMEVNGAAQEFISCCCFFFFVVVVVFFFFFFFFFFIISFFLRACESAGIKNWLK